MIDRGIYNVSYKGLPTEAFVYIGKQQGYGTVPDYELFTGWKSGNTISRKTLETLIEQ